MEALLFARGSVRLHGRLIIFQIRFDSLPRNTFDRLSASTSQRSSMAEQGFHKSEGRGSIPLAGTNGLHTCTVNIKIWKIQDIREHLRIV